MEKHRGWKGLERAFVVAALALGSLEASCLFAVADLGPQEEFTGTVIRVTPDAVELQSKRLRRTFRVSDEKRALLAQLQPGDTITLWFERDARDVKVIRKAKAMRQKAGQVPGETSDPIIDDRAFYGAENSAEPSGRPHG